MNNKKQCDHISRKLYVLGSYTQRLNFACEEKSHQDERFMIKIIISKFTSSPFMWINNTIVFPTL